MFNFLQQTDLILASGSKSRKKLLEDAGLSFDIHPSDVDEQAIKNTFEGDDFGALALKLANEKAVEVSKIYPGSIIIAADQLSVLKGKIYDKPLTHLKAVEQLSSLSGKTHTLYTAVALVKNQMSIWEYVEPAKLTIRALTQETIEHYLKLEKPYHACGSYHFEGLGKWLFESVEADESTIVGLPLLPLYNALLSHNIVQI